MHSGQVYLAWARLSRLGQIFPESSPDAGEVSRLGEIVSPGRGYAGKPFSTFFGLCSNGPKTT